MASLKELKKLEGLKSKPKKKLTVNRGIGTRKTLEQIDIIKSLETPRAGDMLRSLRGF